MAQTKAGALKAAITNRSRYGQDYYKRIASIGGSKKGIMKGFAANPELAKIAGKKGGSVSKRGPAKRKVEYEDERVSYQSY